MKNVGIFIGLIIGLIIIYNTVNNIAVDDARDKGNKLIKNIELYKLKTGEYPKKLENLVPIYYQKIPKHYSSIFNNFEYMYNEKEGTYIFYYTYLAPFGRYFYDIERKEWYVMD